MPEIFKFKQFTIDQSVCAMKVGTDAVLLGSWVSLNQQPNSILDIGAGTGILSLMLAQRSSAQLIDAIEIDDNAYEQCVENFENSPWGDRLFCYHASLAEFASEIEDQYDLIISNPPFFKLNENAISTGGNSRTKARSFEHLPFEELCSNVNHLLNSDGIFAVVIPFDEEENFIKLSASNGLHALRILRVKGTAETQTKRSLIEFSFTKSKTQFEELIIEIDRHIYTPEYINLTKDFYLRM